MINTLAQVVVVLAAIYLIGLAVASILAPVKTAAFLTGFAASAGAHYSEMGVRLVVGASFVVAAPSMLYGHAFSLFGWFLVASSLVLFCVPWRWHSRYARTVVPPLTSRVWVFSLLSLPLGSIVLLAVLYR